MRHSGSKPADAGQLLHPDHVTLHIEQVFGHRAIPGRQPVQFGRSVVRLFGPELPGRQGIGFGGQALQGADDQPVQHRHAEDDEDGRTADPQGAERTNGLADIATGEQERGEPDQDNRG